MPCDAVAVVRTKIAQEVFNESMNSAMLAEALKSVLPNVGVSDFSITVVGEMVTLTTPLYTATFTSRGIDIRGNRYDPLTRKTVDNAGKLLKEIVDTVRATAVQEQVRESLESIGAVTEAQYGNDGVLRIELEV